MSWIRGAIIMLVHYMRHWLSAIHGATAIEYALIVGGISLAAFTAIFLMGDDVNALFNSMAGRLSDGIEEIE
jgi:pilus assembly protein Flp/PilA